MIAVAAVNEMGSAKSIGSLGYLGMSYLHTWLVYMYQELQTDWVVKVLVQKLGFAPYINSFASRINTEAHIFISYRSHPKFVAVDIPFIHLHLKCNSKHLER